MSTAQQAPSPHLPVRPDWLARHSEPALEPGLTIVDAHHHLWDHPHNPYGAADLLADATAGHRILATVFVECGAWYRSEGPPALASLGETESVQRIAQAYGGGPCRIAAGIVGHADLSLGAEVGAILDAHLQAAPGRFKGVRNSSVYHPDPRARGSLANPPPGLLLDPQFRRGFACLEARGLSFDGWMYHTQLGDLEDLARSFAGTSIVLNHVGGPIGIGPYAGQRQAVFSDWQRSIRQLARCENVCVKLGGMGMRLFGFDFADHHQPPDSQALARAWAPYVMECIEAFGPGRCMFESNFPVDKGSASYGVIWNAFKRMTAAFGADDRSALFAGTAARVYGIDLTGAAGLQ